MAGNKTVETGASVRDFIDTVEDERKRRDSRELVTLRDCASLQIG